MTPPVLHNRESELANTRQNQDTIRYDAQYLGGYDVSELDCDKHDANIKSEANTLDPLTLLTRLVQIMRVLARDVGG